MWIKSISILLSVSLFLILVFYMVSYTIFRKNAEKTYSMLLDQVSTSIDLQINEAQKSLHKLLQSYDTAKIAQSDNVNDIALTTYKMELVEQMKSFCQVNGFINDILLYFPKQDYIVSSSTLSDSTISYYASYKDYVNDYLLWRDMFLDHDTGDLFILTTTKMNPVTGNSNVLYYAYQGEPLFGSEPVMAFFSVEGSILAPQIKSMSAESDVDIALMLADGTVFVSNDYNIYDELGRNNSVLASIKENNTAISTMSLSGGDVFLSKSQYMDLFYVIHVRSGYGSYIRLPLVSISIAAFLLILIVTILLIIRYADNTITPLMEIRSMLSTDDLGREDSELKQIRDAIYASNEQVATISSELDVNQAKLQRSYLQALLFGNAPGKGGSDMFAELGFLHNGYAVLMFAPVDDAMLLSENTEAAVFLLLQYDDICKTLQPAGVSLKYLMFDDAFVLAANLDQGDLESWSGLADGAAHDLLVAWTERFDARLAYAYSGINTGDVGLAQSYAEARLAMRYKLLNGLVYRREPRDNPDSMRYYYPTTERNRLINLLKNCSFDEAKRLIEELWQANASGELSDIMLDCLSNDIAGTVMGLSSTIPTGSEDEREFLTHLAYMQKQRPEYRKDSLIKLANMAMSRVGKERADEQADFYKRIEAFIEAHYGDPLLSVESICEHFGRSHNTIYTVVKAGSGEGVLHLINTTRLHKAKELLVQPGATVEKTAQAVGLNSSLALFRLFKRYEGLTPSQFAARNR